MTTLTLRRPRRPLTREALVGAADSIVRLTSGREGGSLRADWRRLDDDERADLVALVPSALSLTGREAKKFERLLERAAGLEPGTFDRERKDSEAASKLAELARRARARPVTSEQEAGLLREILTQVSRDRALHVRHVGGLVILLASFATGENPLGTDAHFESIENEQVLIFDAKFGPFGRSGGGEVGDGWKVLQHLEKNGWLRLSRSGPRVELRLGARSKRVLGAAE